MANTVDLSNITEFHDKPQIIKEKCSQLAQILSFGHLKTSTSSSNQIQNNELIKSLILPRRRPRLEYFPNPTTSTTATTASASCQNIPLKEHEKPLYIIAFTGAGLSASAKIPTFRGPDGCWTRQAQGRPPPKSVQLSQATPTNCHFWIKNLVDAGVIQHVISQNIDGLHRRSGIAKEKLSEVHGNAFLSVCWKCGYDEEGIVDVAMESQQEQLNETEHINKEKRNSSNYGDSGETSDAVSLFHSSKTTSQEVRNEQRQQRLALNLLNRNRCSDCRKRTPQFCHCTKKLCPRCLEESQKSRNRKVEENENTLVTNKSTSRKNSSKTKCSLSSLDKLINDIEEQDQVPFLKDSIVQFNEKLPTAQFDGAWRQAELADVCIVFGSSLTVQPACDFALRVAERGKLLVIVNLQKTDSDERAGIRIFGKTDQVAEIVAKEMKEKFGLDFTTNMTMISSDEEAEEEEETEKKKQGKKKNSKTSTTTKSVSFAALGKNANDADESIPRALVISASEKQSQRIANHHQTQSKSQTPSTFLTKHNAQILGLCKSCSFVVGNYHGFHVDGVDENQLKRKNAKQHPHIWTMFVRPNIPEVVHSVIFKLHPSYSPKVVEIFALDDDDGVVAVDDDENMCEPSEVARQQTRRRNFLFPDDDDEEEQNQRNGTNKNHKKSVSQTRKSEFTLTRTGWAPFDVIVEINLLNGATIKHVHSLRFDIGESSSNVFAK